jgi:hypothetical protein
MSEDTKESIISVRLGKTELKIVDAYSKKIFGEVNRVRSLAIRQMIRKMGDSDAQD